jgi:hypothetical protein
MLKLSRLVACVDVISAQIVTVWLFAAVYVSSSILYLLPLPTASTVQGQTVSTKHCLKTVFAIFPPIAIFKSFVCCAAFDIKSKTDFSNSICSCQSGGRRQTKRQRGKGTVERQVVKRTQSSIVSKAQPSF